MQTKVLEKYFFFGLLLITLIFAAFIFQPFWVVLVLGFSFSIALHPMHEWINRKVLPSRWISSLITVLLFTILLCGPILTIGTLVFNQSENVYRMVTDGDTTSPLVSSIDNTINKLLPSSISFDVEEKTTEFVSYISNNIATIFSATISTFFSFILMLLIIFYFLKDGPVWKKAIIKFSPLGADNDERIFDRLTSAVNGVIKGSLLIALVQGFLLGFGFWIFHIPNGALWGAVAAILSLIPTFGTALVSIPAIIFLYSTGNTAAALSLLVWATIVVGLVDNFLGPIIVGRKINVPSILILFSVLGGISFVGPVGILVGPLTVSLIYALISIYKNKFK